MIQAGRSGKQNIAEGSMASGTSKKTEIKLMNVARASLEELLVDYQDFLRVNNLSLWDKNDQRVREIRELCYRPNRTHKTYEAYFGDAESAANTLICLIHQTNFLLDRQIKALEKDFLENGGFTERMYWKRKENQNKSNGLYKIDRTYKKAFVFLIFCASFFFAYSAFAATEFVSIIDTDGTSGDYSSLFYWEQYNQTDLTSAATQVFSGTRTNAIADDATVYLCRNGVYQTHSGTVVHATSSQILIESISGSATEQANDIWYTNNTCDSANYFTISDGGDSAIAVASCRSSSGTADTTAVTIGGWTTSDTNYIKIWTDPSLGNRHDGKWNEGAYLLNCDDSCIEINENYVRLDGLQAIATRSGSNYPKIISIINVGTSDIRINSCILKANFSGGNARYGIIVQDTDATVRISNTIIWDIVGNSSRLLSAGGATNVYCYNNTLYNGNAGIYITDGTVDVINTVSFNNSDDFDGNENLIDYCASDDGDGTNAVDWNNGATDWANNFVDYANGDFHLKSTAPDLKDAGTDLSSEGFSDDIDGDSRPSPYWDIGADEYPAKQKAKFKGDFRFKGEVKFK